MPGTDEGIKGMMQQANSLLGEADLAELKDAVGIDDASFTEMINDVSVQQNNEQKSGEAGKEPGGTGEEIKSAVKEGGGKSAIDEAEFEKVKNIADKFSKLMEKVGALDEDELMNILDRRSKIMEKFGDRDPDEVFDAARKFTEMDKKWREEQRKGELELDDDDTPLEGEDKYKSHIQQLEASNKELRERLESRETDFADKEKARQLLNNYSERAEKIIEIDGLKGDEAKLARIALNLENPIPDLDLRDNASVTTTAKGLVGDIKAIVQNIKQQAIDEYSAGKSNLEPGGSADTTVKGKHTKEETKDNFKIEEGATVEESFGKMGELLLEIGKNIPSS